MWRINNNVLQDALVIDGLEYVVNTYIEGEQRIWGTPWVVWLTYNGVIMYQQRITERTLEAAEANHKYVLEHAEALLRESEANNGPNF